MALQIQLKQSQGEDFVELSGPINAESEVPLAQLLEQLSSNARFNFKEVGMVNSTGVRCWINFMREIQKRNKSIVFEECTSEIVHQMNMIPSFKAGAKVDSVYGSFVCDSCGHEENYLFSKNPGSELPKKTCPDCSDPLELSEFPDDYFMFWK